MNNKILIVVDKKIKEFSEDLTLKAPCFQLLEKEELLADMSQLGGFETILDGTLGNFLVTDSKKAGGHIEILDSRELVRIEGFEIYRCENLSMIYDKMRMIIFEESVRKLHRVNKMNFEKFLNQLLEKKFPDIDLYELEVETTNKRYKIVKQTPEEKEPGVEYITLETAKGLNRIFDIIDSIVEEKC